MSPLTLPPEHEAIVDPEVKQPSLCPGRVKFCADEPLNLEEVEGSIDVVVSHTKPQRSINRSKVRARSTEQLIVDKKFIDATHVSSESELRMRRRSCSLPRHVGSHLKGSVASCNAPCTKREHAVVVPASPPVSPALLVPPTPDPVASPLRPWQDQWFTAMFGRTPVQPVLHIADYL